MNTHPKPPSGLFDGSRHLFPVRVYYEDTDLSGIVYHANYLKWFERARSDMLRLLGIEQRAAADSGAGFYAVADLSIQYLLPSRLDDELIVGTQVAELGAASVRLRQRAFRGGDLLADAVVRVGSLSPDGRPRRQPAGWRQAFQHILAPKDAA